MRHGLGVIKDKKGSILYEGNFAHNMLDGYGELVLANKGNYKGTFKEDNFHG